MNIQQALDWRYAVRKFTNDRLADTQIHALLEATRKSASSYGLQPYKLVVVESEWVKAKLLPHSFGQQKVLISSHLIVFAAEKNIGDETVDRYIRQLMKVRGVNDESVAGYSAHIKQALAAKTRVQKREWAHQQAYIALGTFLTSAALMQIDSCPMTGIDTQAYDEVLELGSRGLETSAIVALGVRSGDDESADLPKVRFDFNDIVLRI